MNDRRWAPNGNDLRVMKANLETAQFRSIVDYGAAERLRFVIEHYENSEAVAANLEEQRSGLESEVEDFEIDVDDFRVDVDGALDDLNLSPSDRAAIDKAIEKANAQNRTALSIRIEEVTKDLKARVEKLGELIDDLRGDA